MAIPVVIVESGGLPVSVSSLEGYGFPMVESESGVGLAVTIVEEGSGGGMSVTGITSVIEGSPVNTVAPVISGTTTIGQTLSCTTGTWSGTPTSYAYRWRRNGALIVGATASTYVLVAADNAAAMTCRVIASNATGASAPAYSNTLTLSDVTPVNSVAPVISGTLNPSSVLSATTGTWSNTPSSYTYQWTRAGSAISGATASTYTLVSADQSSAIVCQVTAVKLGVTSAPAASNTLTVGSWVPANTVAPVISGTTTVGSTLSCTTGTWTFSPSSYAYQWLRAGAAITSATASTYLLVSADAETSITCRVTATNTYGTSSAATSNALVIDAEEGGTETTFEQDGLIITADGTLTQGTYVDGSIWVVAPPGGVPFVSQEIDAGEVASLYNGLAVMIDPEGLALQAWDDRGLPVTGRGPAIIYDDSVGFELPQTVDHYPDGSPKTIWFYRGHDSVTGGGATSGCEYIVQITVVASAPAANAIKPTGFYVAGGKRQVTQDDINYDAITPVAIPSGAVEPDWDVIEYLVRPMVHTGIYADGFGEGFCNPLLGDPSGGFPASNAAFTGQLFLGAISNSSRREELIDRIVRQGLEYHAQAAFHYPCFISGGGFGVGFGPLVFMASIFLEDPTMRETPDDILLTTGRTVEFYGEHGMSFLGEPDEDYPEGVPLFGNTLAPFYPDGPFHDNHDARDPNGLREPHWVTRLTGTAQAGSSTTIQFAADTPNSTVSDNGYAIYIVSGPGAGQTRLIPTGGWNDTTKTASNPSLYNGSSYVSTNWSPAPNNTSVYEYYNGGWYQDTATQKPTGMAVAIVTAGLADEWNEFDTSGAWLYYNKRWFDNNGQMTPRSGYDYPQDDGSIWGRQFYDAANVWVKRFYDTYAEAIWPQQSEPVAPITFTTVSFTGSQYLSRAALTGVADSKAFTLAVRYKATDTATMRAIIGTTAAKFIATHRSTDLFSVDGQNSAGSLYSLQIAGTTGSLDNADGTQTIFIAARVNTGTQVAQVYRGSTNLVPTGVTYNDEAIDFTHANWYLFHNAATEIFQGQVEFVWFDTVYYDVSDSAVRAAFTADTIGADGSGPGAQPKIFMWGDASVWNAGTNAGTGGNFTMTGTVANTYTPPTISTLTPADGATDIAIAANLSVVFNQAVQFGTGDINIYKASDDSLFENFDVVTHAGTKLTISGDTLTINPAGTLLNSTAYYVQIDATAIENVDNMPFAGIADETTWNFTTAAAAGAFSTVLFDGTNDYLSRSGAVMADANEFTMVVRCQRLADGAFHGLLNDSGAYIVSSIRSTDFVSFQFWSSSAIILAADATTSTFTTADGMQTIYIAGRAHSTPVVQIYKGSTNMTPTGVTATTGTINFNRSSWNALSATSGAQKFNANVQFFWFDTVYHDVSDSTVRDKWLAANIAADGTVTGGTQPKIYFTGNASVWNAGTNLGSGGNFVMTGAVTNV